MDAPRTGNNESGQEEVNRIRGQENGPSSECSKSIKGP